MAVPFSSTQLRVPRGFGSVLEGLAREVLRDQPDDIPAYAAIYFDRLLKERDDSGLDPAAWAARLEDRFYNNRAFQAIPPATDVTSCTEKPDGVTGDVPESDRRRSEEEVTAEDKLPQEESHGMSHEDVGVEEEDEDQTRFTTSNREDQELTENSVPFSTDKDISQSELDHTNVLLSRSDSMKDVSAEELGAIEYEEDPSMQDHESPSADHEIRETSDVSQITAAKSAEELPYYGLADTDVCAEELQQTDNANMADDDLHAHTTQEEELPGESSLSRSRPATASLQETDPQEEKTLEHRGLTETHGLEARELLSSAEGAGGHLQEEDQWSDSEAAPQEEALVEINFDDVPEVQEMVEAEARQPGEECSLVEQSEQQSESRLQEDIILAGSGHGEDGVQNTDEPNSETDGQEKAGKAEREEMDDVDAGDLALSNVGYEGGLNETVLSSKPSAEIKIDFDNGKEKDSKDAYEVEHRGYNDPETLNTYDETEDPLRDGTGDENRAVSREVKEDSQEEELPAESHDGGAGIKWNETKPGKEDEEEAVDTAEEQNPAEMKDRPLVPVEGQPEDPVEGTGDRAAVTQQTTGAEETGIEGRGAGASHAQGEVSGESHHLDAGRAHDDDHEADLGPPEPGHDVTETQTQDQAKEGECSRPQEEEEDIMDIPLDDPEANKAAAKIQAGFRGHMTRKKMKPEEKAEGEERQEERGQ